MARTGVVLAAISMLVASTAAQQQPAFDVASVHVRTRPSGFVPASDLVRSSTLVTEERVHLVQPLRSILLSAFRVKDYQLVAPDWVNELFVEIRATIPPDGTIQHVPEMLRGLLVERFGLTAHNETRMMDVYQLRVAATGIRMREVGALNEVDTQFKGQSTRSGMPLLDSVTQTPEGPVRTIAIPGGSRRITSRTMYETTADSVAATRTINAVRMTMPEFVSILTLNVDEPVVDRTGLNGIYQFTVELPRDEIFNRALRSLGKGRDIPSGTASTLKALETLGLTLERRGTDVHTLVIDSISRTPTPN